MPAVSVIIDQNFTFKKISNDVNSAFKTGIRNFTKDGARFLKNSVPVKSGKLKDSIEYTDDTIWTSSDVYKYLDKGVKPHKIVGYPLVFIINGIEIFTTVVNHPGIKAHKFTDNTLDYMDTKISIVRKEIDEVL